MLSKGKSRPWWFSTTITNSVRRHLPLFASRFPKFWNLDDIDCDFSSKDKLPTEDLKCVVYRGDKKTKVTLHASENKLGLYAQDGKRFPIK